MSGTQILKEYLGEIKALTEENERLKIELHRAQNAAQIAAARAEKVEREWAIKALEMEERDEHD